MHIILVVLQQLKLFSIKYKYNIIKSIKIFYVNNQKFYWMFISYIILYIHETHQNKLKNYFSNKYFYS